MSQIGGCRKTIKCKCFRSPCRRLLELSSLRYFDFDMRSQHSPGNVVFWGTKAVWARVPVKSGLVRLGRPAGCLLKFSRRDLRGGTLPLKWRRLGVGARGWSVVRRWPRVPPCLVPSHPIPRPLLMSPLQYFRKLKRIMTDWIGSRGFAPLKLSPQAHRHESRRILIVLLPLILLLCCWG